MGVTGASHLTLSCADVERTTRFYVDVLGCGVVARWPTGAYLAAGELWVALVHGRDETRRDDDYSHVAFHVDAHRFAEVATRIQASGVPQWQDNWTEGDSIYFTDPDGHRLEIHATTFAARIEDCRATPWDGLVLADDAEALAVPRPSVADPRKPRRLACAPVGVFVVVVDAEHRVLLLEDAATGRLEVPNGAMEPGEDPASTAVRELAEEAGPVETAAMHSCAAFTVDYHPELPPLLSLGFVCRYLGGVAVPGDDMAHCTVRWSGLDDIDEDHLAIPAEVGILRTAVTVLDALG